MRTILLSGLRKSDELVFSSLLSLLSNNTEEKWEITKNGMSDITVIDVDSSGGLSLARSLEKCGRQVIRVTTHSDTDEPGLWLHKPVRSTEILKCIALLNESKTTVSNQSTETKSPQTATSTSTVETIRLRRWPSRATLKAFPNSNKLCAILIRRAITLEQAEKISNLNKQQLNEFIESCKKQKCLLVAVQRSTNQSLPKAVASAPATLFSKLRLKLMSK